MAKPTAMINDEGHENVCHRRRPNLPPVDVKGSAKSCGSTSGAEVIAWRS